MINVKVSHDPSFDNYVKKFFRQFEKNTFGLSKDIRGFESSLPVLSVPFISSEVLG